MPVRIQPTGSIRGVALAAVLLLAGCGGGNKAGGPAGPAFTQISAGVFTVVIAPNADIAKTEAAFRKYCDGRQSCTIYGWTNPADVASRAPLDDRHYQALAVRYVAQAAGTDDMMWDCLRFPKARAPCLPKA